jgi:hypothetical protein
MRSPGRNGSANGATETPGLTPDLTPDLTPEAFYRLQVKVAALEKSVMVLQDLCGIPVGVNEDTITRRGRGAGAGELMRVRRKAIAILLAAEQPLIQSVIGRRVGIPVGDAIFKTMACDWWKRTPDGFVLTPKGNQAAGKEK